MKFPERFICAGENYADYDRIVPAPYLRRSFYLDKKPEEAGLTITGLGFYRVFVNGTEITKGILAPYISNPDDIVYYDRYNLTDLLESGENVVGLILGNGMQNAFGGYVWDFEKARWRGAPKTALEIVVKDKEGERTVLESDTEFKTHASPIVMNDLRMGEYYDARLELEGWCEPGFDDSKWEKAVLTEKPRGEFRICGAEPIAVSRELAPVSVSRYKDGYLYDFGINSAGRVRLRIKGTQGQEIHMYHGEWYHDGILDRRNTCFKMETEPRAQHMQHSSYICRGDGEEVFAPCFSYYGFQYVYVSGITEEQAVPGLLTFEVMHSDLEERGNFKCSDETANKLQEITRRSTLANFYYFPTDCPHREKNGWTGDAAISAEHTLLNLGAEKSYREWLNNIRAAQDESGKLPGIVPTGGWGFDWGNGPAWDAVLTYLPYFLLRYRGDLEIVRENAASVFRYLHYLSTRMDDRGIVEIGLGDWCPPGRDFADYKAPLAVTDTIISMDIAKKAAKLFQTAKMELQQEFAEKLAARLRDAFRRNFVDFDTMAVEGECQTSQAMALYYGIFEEGETEKSFQRLLEYIEECGGHLDTGILGSRVVFHVLSKFGYADLAYEMITRPDFPSYGYWIEQGATSLWEEFYEGTHEDGNIGSLNHHFFGDISNWFIQSVGGIVMNPEVNDVKRVDIAPHFIEKLNYADAEHTAPLGEIKVHWERTREQIRLELSMPSEMNGSLCAPEGWVLENGLKQIPAASGKYIFKKQ